MAIFTKSLDNEIWKEIEDFPNFEISNLGRLKKRSKGKWILFKPVMDYPKYHIGIKTSDNKRKVKIFNIHRLVAKYFIENNNPEKIMVNHKDGNKLNYDISNLEWVTPSQNNIHAYKHGLNKRNKDGWGSNNRPIVGLHIITGVIREFGGVRVAERELDLASASVKEVCKGRSSHAKGWFFMYYEDYCDKGFPKDINPIPRFNKKAVRQISPVTGVTLHIFETARQAANATDANFSKISSVCNGHRKTAGGYKWKFVDNPVI